MRIRSLLVIATVLGTVLIVLAGLGAIKWAQVQRAMSMGGPPEPVEAVVVAQVVSVEWRPSARLSGTAFAIQSVTLSNEVAGTIREVLFQSGSIVRRGEVLVQLDTSTQQAELDAAVASLRVAEAQVLSAESNRRLREAQHRRLTRAGAAGAATDLEIDQSQANLDQAEALLTQARAEVDQAAARVRLLETTIAKMSLRAPFDARAGLRHVHPGQYLAEGTGVVSLQSIGDRIHLDFAVPQDQAWRVKPSDVVMASVPALSAEPLPITVVATDAVADRGTRNVRVRGEIANPGERLRPGMWVDVEVPTDAPSERLAVPATAIRRAPYGDYVFVIEPDRDDPARYRARQRLVSIGPSSNGMVIITAGLRQGESVATDGSFKLRDGALVRPGPPSGASNGRVAAARRGGPTMPSEHGADPGPSVIGAEHPLGRAARGSPP